MLDAAIVGAGLFGQIIAAGLRAQGRHVQVFDSYLPEAGSLASACLMKPSWFSGMGKAVTDPSLDLLDKLYGLTTLKFKTRPKLLNVDVFWTSPRKILAPEATYARVAAVRPGEVEFDDGEVVRARVVVVAAGIWTEALIPQVKQVGQKGAAFLIPGAKLKEQFIWPYAPYRQLVAFNRGDGIWVGDGTAILEKNWSYERLAASWERMEKGLRSKVPAHKAHTMIGIRPYAKGAKPCIIENFGTATQPVWAATGGAKNGTIAAGYCAHTIREATS